MFRSAMQFKNRYKLLVEEVKEEVKHEQAMEYE